MPQMIHYHDDLFYVSMYVKSLDAVLSTEADPEFFLDHILAQIGFLDGAIRKIASMLRGNALLIDRSEYLKLLERTVRTFSRILEKLTGGDYPRSEAFAQHASRLRETLVSQKQLLAELGGELSAALSGDAETDHVSQDELSGLLREDES